ncbi:UDP-N-acetylmuramate dehydrogenase [Mycoplasma sp. P36-A1]|uniref:UDP-N-acetylmuramate dehydrogenase n=1 Tax=Mycoplasma sp. P36-A1 TaxID=3252900 RepID=UPI003C2B7325
MKKKIHKDLINLGVSNIIIDEPLYKHTTYRVGGPANIYVESKNYQDIVNTIDYAIKNKINYFVLGAGSNVLINDKPFQGIIISTRLLNSYEISGNEVYAECGVSMIALAVHTANAGLTGLEFASGIPGCIGGSAFMNAGAYKKSMSDVISEVLLYRNGNVEWVNVEELEFSYRHSILQTKRDWIVLAVKMYLEEEDPENIKQLINDRKKRRMDTQPYDAYSAGSVFKNPSKELSSWKLIDDAMLRGYKINDAQVSIKHPNFIINTDRASAKDIYELIKLVQTQVNEKFNVKLKIEVELVNFNGEK